MRQIQSYQSFSTEVNESWNDGLSHFEQACLNEGVDLGDYAVLNEDDQDFMGAISDAVKKGMEAASKVVGGAEKAIASAFSNYAKSNGAKGAIGKAAQMIAKDSKISDASKIYIKTLEKLLADAKKNPSAFMTEEAKKSLGSLLSMNVQAQAAVKRAAQKESKGGKSGIESAIKFIKDLAPKVMLKAPM